MKSSTKTFLLVYCLLLSIIHSTALGQEKSPGQNSHAVENQAVPASKIHFVAGKDGDLFGKKRSFIENIGQYGVYKGGEIYVPSAFTPNGDGKNDVLKAIPIGIKKFLYFSIYNRWGQRIFFTTEPSKGWNGKIEDKLQSGVFVWIAEGTDYAGKNVTRKGTTIVIR